MTAKATARRMTRVQDSEKAEVWMTCRACIVRIDDDESVSVRVIFCPLHAAAREMLVTLKALVAGLGWVADAKARALLARIEGQS